jgi:hypothetical protein
MFGGGAFKTTASIDRDTNTGILFVETAPKKCFFFAFTDTGAALAMTEALLHLCQEMMKGDKNASQDKLGERIAMGDDIAQLVESFSHRVTPNSG